MRPRGAGLLRPDPCSREAHCRTPISSGPSISLGILVSSRGLSHGRMKDNNGRSQVALPESRLDDTERRLSWSPSWWQRFLDDFEERSRRNKFLKMKLTAEFSDQLADSR